MNERVTMEQMSPLIAEMLELNGRVTMTVVGYSMQPMLYNRRDTVTLIRPTFPLKKYDIPLYKMDDGRYFLHRIIKCHPDGSYTCRGDNNWNVESPVFDRQIIGVVESFVRNGKETQVKGSFLYFLYSRTWGVLHHLKFLYKYWRNFKTTIKRRKQELFEPIKSNIKKEDGRVEQITYRYGRKSEIKEIQELVSRLAMFENEQLGNELANPNWAYSPEAKTFFENSIDNEFLYVAAAKDKLVGCITGRIQNKILDKEAVALCGNIFVDPEYRGAGIATRFLELFKDYCRERNCKHIRINVTSNNENAERLYRKNGFEDHRKTLICRLED